MLSVIWFRIKHKDNALALIEKGFFKTKLGKVLLILLGLFAIAFAISELGYYYIQNSFPTVIRNSFEEAKASKKILSRTGEIIADEFTYNENDLKKDSLKFHIKLTGENETVLINAIAAKDSQKVWRVCKSDTVFIKE